MGRGRRENGMFRFSWFIKKRNMQFAGFFVLAGPFMWTWVYCYKNWEKLGLNTNWYNTLNNRLDQGYKMRLQQGLADPDALRARLNKLQAPEEYADHLPADDFVAHHAIYRKD